MTLALLDYLKIQNDAKLSEEQKRKASADFYRIASVYTAMRNDQFNVRHLLNYLAKQAADGKPVNSRVVADFLKELKMHDLKDMPPVDELIQDPETIPPAGTRPPDTGPEELDTPPQPGARPDTPDN